jgi:predicted PurR-regulated permease PerM
LIFSGRTALPVLLLATAAYAFLQFREVLLPFLLAATLAYVLNPAVSFFEIRGIRRERAVLVIYTIVLFTFVSCAYLGVTAVMQSASNMAADMPRYVGKAREFIARLDDYAWLRRLGVSAWIEHQFMQDGTTWLLKAIEQVPALIRHHLLPLLEMAFLIPFLTYFFMMDGQSFFEKLIDFVPSRYVEMFLNVIVEINHSFGKYLRSLMLQAFCMGILTGIGYGMVGLHYVVYIAFWAAVSSMVPFVGPISAAVVAGVVALFQWGTFSGMMKIIGVFFAIRTIDDWFLNPFILRAAVHMHPVVTLFALLAGAYCAGLWGLLFAVPTMCMIKVLLEVAWQWYATEYGLQRKTLASEIVDVPLV